MTAVTFFVVVDANEAVKATNLPPSTRLFVYAKQVDGPPMPVAAVPLNPPFEWPILVTLTDRNSLNPERLLSGFDELSFSAKLRFSGSATPAADDVQSDAVINPKTNNQIFVGTRIQGHRCGSSNSAMVVEAKGSPFSLQARGFSTPNS